MKARIPLMPVLVCLFVLGTAPLALATETLATETLSPEPEGGNPVALPPAAQPALELSWGSWNGQYLAAITQMEGLFPLPWGGLDLSVQLRSHGSWYFFSPNTWDTGFQLFWTAPWTLGPLEWQAGIGAEIQWRLHKDERSLAETTWSPRLQLNPVLPWQNWELSLPMSLFFYSDGMLGRVELQVVHRWAWISAHLRAEFDGLIHWSSGLTEGRLRTFVGTGFLF